MADITNPQAVKFCNERARPIADLIASLYRSMPIFMLEVVRDFEAHTQGNADSDPIIDGSAQDGRPPVVKFNVGELKFVIEQLQACMDTADRVAVVNKWQVNGTPIF